LTGVEAQAAQVGDGFEAAHEGGELGVWQAQGIAAGEQDFLDGGIFRQPVCRLLPLIEKFS
jgi:hypothetical protein